MVHLLNPVRHDKTVRKRAWKGVFFAMLFLLLPGCGPEAPPASVEGTLRLNGKSLDNCLVTFTPMPGQGTDHLLYSTGKTDAQGFYRLRSNTQQRGTATGWHRVTIQDLSASSGTPRQDHGTAEMEAQKANVMARPARIRPCYSSPQETPLSKEIKQGHQVIDLDLM